MLTSNFYVTTFSIVDSNTFNIILIDRGDAIQADLKPYIGSVAFWIVSQSLDAVINSLLRFTFHISIIRKIYIIEAFLMDPDGLIEEISSFRWLKHDGVVIVRLETRKMLLTQLLVQLWDCPFQCLYTVAAFPFGFSLDMCVLLRCRWTHQWCQLHSPSCLQSYDWLWFAPP